MASDYADPEWPTQRRKKAFSKRTGIDSLSRVCVYLPDTSCICVDLLDGLSTTASEVLAAIISQDELGLPSAAIHVFGIWATSPLLEIQLKQHNSPVEIFNEWQSLLKRFSAEPDAARASDEPVLELRRSVFLSIKEEEQCARHPVISKYLYLEAERNFVTGRFPCSDPDVCTSLGAISAKIHYGGQDIKTNTNELIRSHLTNLLPLQLRRASWSWFSFMNSAGKNSPEARLLEKYREIPGTKEDRLVQKYLELCRFYPFYGSVYFHGQIEEPSTGLQSIFKMGDTKVLIALNAKGLHVIDQEKEELILSLAYESFSWDIKSPKDLSAYSLPCLYVVFPGPDIYGRRTVRIVQLFTKQVAMIDALIAFWTNGPENRSAHDEPDGGHAEPLAEQEDVLTPLTSRLVYRSPSEVKVFSKVDRLCLATFDEDGNLIDKQGSWKLRNGVVG